MACKLYDLWPLVHEKCFYRLMDSALCPLYDWLYRMSSNSFRCQVTCHQGCEQLLVAFVSFHRVPEYISARKKNQSSWLFYNAWFTECTLSLYKNHSTGCLPAVLHHDECDSDTSPTSSPAVSHLHLCFFPCKLSVVQFPVLFASRIHKRNRSTLLGYTLICFIVERDEKMDTTTISFL